VLESGGQHFDLLAFLKWLFKEAPFDFKAEFWFDCWLNFVGSAFGWCAAYVVVKMLMWWQNAGIGSAIVVLAATLVGFIGISGYLPYVVLRRLKFRFGLPSYG
jgi:hypothetical protein